MNNHATSSNFSIYYTWKNDELELPDSSYLALHIQFYIDYIIVKHETLPSLTHVNIYISRINNRLVFKIKDGYKPELQTPKTIKSFGSTKN